MPHLSSYTEPLTYQPLMNLKSHEAYLQGHSKMLHTRWEAAGNFMAMP